MTPGNAPIAASRRFSTSAVQSGGDPSDNPGMGIQDDGAPIVSALAGNPDVQQRLEAFVIALGERVDVLQDFESAADWKGLAADARGLGHEATALGFAPLALAAAAVEQAGERAARGVPGLSARDSVLALTDVARRVRLGHRGAAY